MADKKGSLTAGAQILQNEMGAVAKVAGGPVDSGSGVKSPGGKK